MYGINLQLFNSKLRLSIFDNLPKKLHFRKTCGYAQIVQKKLAKTKIPFHAQKKILRTRFSHFVETLCMSKYLNSLYINFLCLTSSKEEMFRLKYGTTYMVLIKNVNK